MLETYILKKKIFQVSPAHLTVVETEAQSDLPKVTHEVYSTQVLCFLCDLSSHVFCSCITWSHYLSSVSLRGWTRLSFMKHALTKLILCSCCFRHRCMLNSTLLPLPQADRRASVSICQEESSRLFPLALPWLSPWQQPGSVSVGG